jgi:excisionase family DNA binding protein
MSHVVPEEGLMTIAEVATRLSVSEKTIRRYVERGELPALRLGHERGPLRIDRAELTAWLFAPTRSQR